MYFFIHGFKKNTLFRPLVIAMFLFVSLATVEATEAKNTKSLETVNLQLKWIHHFQFAGYYAAKEQGYYADVGLDVQIHEFNPEKPVIKQVVSGAVDYGIGDVGVLFNYANGAPVKALAAIFQHNPLIFISKQSSGIVSPYEMLGKRVMQRSTATDDAPLRVMLADAGIGKDQYTSVKHSFIMEDFISGKVDVMSGYITDQPFKIRQSGVKINIINPLNYGIDFYGDILYTSIHELKRHPGRAERFLQATLKGWRYAFDHTEELIQLIKKQYNSKASIEQLRNEAIETRKLVLPDIVPLGEIKVNRLRYVSDAYNRLNLAEKLTDGELANFIFIKAKKVNLNKQERAWLQQHPVIRLGIDRDFAPYEWIDEDGHYDGIAADYIKLLEQRLNITFKNIKDKNSWHDVLNMAKRGKLDMLSCLVKTPGREQFLNFSKPYLSSSAVIISEYSNGYIGSLKSLAGKRVAIQKGHYTQEILTKKYPEIEIVTTTTIEKALRMVSEGLAYAYVGDVTAASYAMKKEGFLNLMFSGSTPYQSKFRFATHKNNPMLASIISKALATITKAERDAIYNHWQALQIPQGVNVNLLVKYVLAVLCLFVLFGYWIYRLRHTANALKASEAKLQLILDTEPECVKVIDDKGCLVQMNPAGLKLIEAEDNSSFIFGKQVNALVVAEYRQAFNDMNARVLNGESCILQYQFEGLKGTVRWVETRAVPLVDEVNHSVSILSVTIDISEQKKTEEAQKIAAMVYQHSSEAMLVTDSENLIIAINPAFSKITGYDFEEVKGKNPSILQSGMQDSEFYKEMWDSINHAGHWEGEIWNRHKDGNEYAEWLVINTIYNGDGTVAQRVSLFSDITEKKKAEKIIWVQANFDSLTQLPNRNMFLDRLNQDIKIAARSERPLAVLFLDLDHFKEVNDSLGHDKGDELLCETAKRLTACVRESDTVARLGGDEFIIILPELDRSLSIDRVAENIIQSLRQVFKLGDEQAYVSASLGIALYPNDANDAEGLVKHADQAMYLSKDKGRAQFSYFTSAMQEQAQYRLQLMKDMRGALITNQFELYYQPIVTLTTGQIDKAEALIRWNHPARGLVSPVDFIPLAEKSGLIIEIGDWVFKEAARQVKYWRECYKNNLQVSINKSPVQFQAATNRDDWLKYLKQIDLSGDAIVIEITEGLLMDSAENINYQLLQYRDAGIQVSMDDFGTGYSALSYLNKFDIDYLKIDRSFTRNLAPGSSDMALSEAIILMSHKLGLKVIAEGIETEQQRKLLTAAGCNYGQGYLFSKPVPVDEFEELLGNNEKALT